MPASLSPRPRRFSQDKTVADDQQCALESDGELAELMPVNARGGVSVSSGMAHASHHRMTSLAHQLKRLALPQNDPNLLSRREVVSVLFDPKEAAGMDRSTFYALGCTGLEELLGIESAFFEFQKTLFSQASLTLERSVQSKEVNKKLDQSISLFLTRLSPYFLLKPALKCIEWLIHRFHIHLYNQDALIACVLPYHETKVFVRVIQLFKIKDPTHKWHWLHGLQKPGVPLARGTLLTHCYKDLGFMDFICTMVTNSFKAYSDQAQEGKCPQLRVIFSFYASTIVSALDAMEKITDSVIAKLLPFIQLGLKSKISDYVAATYMIVCQMAVKVVMEAKLVESLTIQLCRSLRKAPLLVKEGLSCILVLLQNQKDGVLSPKVFGYLSALPSLVPTLQSIATVHDISPLLRYMLPLLIHSGMNHNDEEQSEGSPDISRLLQSVFQNLQLSNILENTAASRELSPYELSALNRRIQPTVRIFESSLMKNVSSDHDKRLLHQFIILTMSCGKYQILPDSEMSLMLSLKHSMPSVRKMAIDYLNKVFTSEHSSFDEAFLKEALLERIKDDAPEVVLSALKSLQLHLSQVDAEETASCLISRLHGINPSDDWSSVLTEIVQVLQDPRLTEVLKEVLAKTSEGDLLVVANEMLTTTLIKNVANMDHGTKHNTLESLCDLLRRLGSTVRDRAAFVLLSSVLLQILQSVQSLHSLHLAQCVYKLLEPSVLQLSAIQLEQDGNHECLPVCVALGEYLQRTNLTKSAEREHALLLLSLLRLFITTLRSPDSMPKDQSWWNIEKMNSDSCCYVHLLCRLFDVVISGASQGPLSACFRSLMHPLLQVHLHDPTVLFKFLTLLWGFNNNLENQLDCRVGVILQTQALYVGKALLSSQPVKILNQLAAGNSPVVPSLILCLSCVIGEVRRAAIGVLQSLSGVVSSPYHPFVETLLKSSEEIIADPSYLTQLLSKFYEEAALGKGKKEKMTSINQLLQSVLLPCCPSYTSKAMLQALKDVHEESILSILLPAMERLLEQCVQDSCAFLPDEALLLQLLLCKFNETTAPLLVKDPRCLELFIRAINTSAQPHTTIPSFQIIALEQITRPFFAAIGDEKIQQKILSVLFDLLVRNKSPVCAQTVNSVFKGIAVDAELVANEMMPVEKQKVTGTVQQIRRSTMKKPPESSETVSEESAISWPRVTLILELLQHKKKLRRAQYLVPALFNLLSRCLEPAAADQENIEYTKQLILICLLNVCQKLSPDGGPISSDVLEEDKFNVELVVQCVRMSDVPQTHHHALLLLGALAETFPEKVLHNIMPIFTFMGANIMRLDDLYSFQIINKTVQAVIPALIKAHEGGSVQSEGRMETVATRIIHVFVDALPHVPEHRRLPILSQLMETLGPTRFLWILILLLFKQHITQTSGSTAGAEKDAAVEKDQEFWIRMCCEFEVKEQLTSIIRILQYLMTLPQDKEEAPQKPKTRGKSTLKEETVSDLIFSLEVHSNKDLRHFKFLSISFMAQLLASNRFIGKVADCEDITESSLQALQQELLVEVLRYINSVARCVEDNSDKPTAKFWKAMLSKSYDTLDKITALLELIGTLLTIVGGIPGQTTTQDEELAINRQTALYSLKLLCRNFGSKNQEIFVPVLNKAVELVENEEEEKNVMGSALLCVAEIISTLKALAIPQLHRLMPAVLEALKKRKDLLNNEIYLLSAVTALQRATESLPHFISPYLLEIISQVARLTRLAEQLTSCPQLASSVKSLQSTLATKVPPRVLIPTITKCYTSMVDAHQVRLPFHQTTADIERTDIVFF
ncbi:hypothetical protein DNTS_028326 [Danionella cerebrum]|uniref:HEAT repeat-containing protein 1 n=1 Tax=Danionella cerebrum TaxID=2873325 RepID=A0A553NLV7_9TELE|nr:hypothetical protein DNTS_028326 [Danionella translucida]